MSMPLMSRMRGLPGRNVPRCGWKDWPGERLPGRGAARSRGRRPVRRGGGRAADRRLLAGPDDFAAGRHRGGQPGSGIQVAVVDWPAAAAALGTGLPCSGGERRLLQVTASLAAGIPVDLRDAAAGLDGRAPGWSRGRAACLRAPGHAVIPGRRSRPAVPSPGRHGCGTGSPAGSPRYGERDDEVEPPAGRRQPRHLEGQRAAEDARRPRPGDQRGQDVRPVVREPERRQARRPGRDLRRARLRDRRAAGPRARPGRRPAADRGRRRRGGAAVVPRRRDGRSLPPP